MSDADLVRGDRGFERWYRSAYPPVFSAVLLYCQGDRCRAEDSTAEAFVKAYERWNSVLDMKHPEAWVAKVAINHARSRWRRLRRETLSSTSPERQAQEVELLDGVVWQHVAELPPRQRAAVVLKYVYGYTQRDVANELNVASGTVAATLSTARSQLRRQM